MSATAPTTLECGECGRASDYLDWIAKRACPKCGTDLADLGDLLADDGEQ